MHKCRVIIVYKTRHDVEKEVNFGFTDYRIYKLTRYTSLQDIHAYWIYKLTSNKIQRGGGKQLTEGFELHGRVRIYRLQAGLVDQWIAWNISRDVIMPCRDALLLADWLHVTGHVARVTGNVTLHVT